MKQTSGIFITNTNLDKVEHYKAQVKQLREALTEMSYITGADHSYFDAYNKLKEMVKQALKETE